MSNPLKSVFGADVDRFFLGKLLFGLLAIASLLTSAGSFIRAAILQAGSGSASGSAAGLVETGFWSALSGVIWILAFQWVERARRKSIR